MIEKILNMKLGKFIDVFKNDTCNLLELIFINEYDTSCKIKIHKITRNNLITNKAYEILVIDCKKYVAGEVEHLEITIDDISRYYKMTIVEFMIYLENRVWEEYIRICEIATKLGHETINDYLSTYNEVIE